MSIALVGILGSMECLGQQMLASKYSGVLCFCALKHGSRRVQGPI